MKQPWMTEEEHKRAKKNRNTNPSEENKEHYRRVSREVDRMYREAKKRWIENKCERCEISFRTGNSKELYRTVKELTRE